MEDDLTNFFAKRDKKKSKFNQFSTVNEIDKKLKDTDKKREKCLKQNDEWNDYEEIKKDYTGLKIHNSTGIEENDEEGGANGINYSSFTWNRLEAKIEENDELIKTAEDKTEVVRAPVWVKLTTPSVGVYIPPQLRNRSDLGLNRRNPKDKLNIDDTNTFPILTPLATKKKPSEESGLIRIKPQLCKNMNNTTQVTSNYFFNNSVEY